MGAAGPTWARGWGFEGEGGGGGEEEGAEPLGGQLEATSPPMGTVQCKVTKAPRGTISQATSSRQSPIWLWEPPSPVCSQWLEAIQAPHTTARSAAQGFTWAWRSVAAGWVGPPPPQKKWC